MDLSAFHGQQSGYPNDQGRKEDSDGIGCKGLALLHFKKIGGDTPGIDSGSRQRYHHKKYDTQKTKALYLFSRALFGTLPNKNGRLFIKSPFDQVTVDVFQKEHHEGKHQYIGSKANDKHQIFIGTLINPVGYTNFCLSEWGKAPKCRYE